MKQYCSIIAFLHVLLFAWVSLTAQDKLELERTFPGPADNYSLNHAYFGALTDSSIIISDAVDHTVKILSLEGRLITELGGKGMGDGEFHDPLAVTCNPVNRMILIEDSGNRRLCCVAFSGEFSHAIGLNGPVRSMESYGDFIYISDYTEQQGSLFKCWSLDGSSSRGFGELFDKKVNVLKDLKSYLYGATHVVVNNDRLYAFYEFLPFMEIYTLECELQKRVSIDWPQAAASYRHNTDLEAVWSGRSIRFRHLINNIEKWDSGFVVSLPEAKMLVYLDSEGRIQRQWPMPENKGRRQAQILKPLGGIGNRLFMLNGTKARVEVYRVSGLSPDTEP